jgi:DNA-binding SARP family transcriptional activator
MARRIREANGELSLADFKTLVREQFYLLILDQREAVDAVADLLPADPEQRRAGLNLIRQVLGARKDLSPEEEKRFAEITQIFGMDEESRTAGRSRRESQQRSSASEADRGRRLAS